MFEKTYDFDCVHFFPLPNSLFVIVWFVMRIVKPFYTMLPCTRIPRSYSNVPLFRNHLNVRRSDWCTIHFIPSFIYIYCFDVRMLDTQAKGKQFLTHKQLAKNEKQNNVRKGIVTLDKNSKSVKSLNLFVHSHTWP